MKPKSDNLFHFTKSIDVLERILSNGIYPRFCLEDIRWMGIPALDYLAFPMACFCDIPLSRISEHTDFYGEYGIGLTKEWGAKNNLNPVAYSPPGGQIQELMKFFFKARFDENQMDFEEAFHSHAFKLWSLIKPTIGNMIISGSVIEKEFYQENEWRYVPPEETMLEEDVFEKEKENSNKDIEKFKIEISPADIKYIFVRNDTDIPRLVDYINNNLGHFPLNDLKILQSRIVSLDTLNNDL